MQPCTARGANHGDEFGDIILRKSHITPSWRIANKTASWFMMIDNREVVQIVICVPLEIPPMKKKKPEQADKPGFVVGDHFSGTTVTRRLKRPTRKCKRIEQTRAGEIAELLPAWSCSRWGLPSRTGHPARWCALTAPFHPYLCRREKKTAEPLPQTRWPSAVYFLLHWPDPHGRWELPTTALYGARTFLHEDILRSDHLAYSGNEHFTPDVPGRPAAKLRLILQGHPPEF